MSTVTWTPSEGSPLVLQSPFRLLDFAGIGGPPVDIRALRAPYQDGATLVDNRLAPRDIRLDVLIEAMSVQDWWDKRRQLVAAFNPKLKVGTLKIEDGTNTYEIGCFPDGAPIFGSTRTPLVLRATLMLMAPHPLFYDPTKLTGEFHLNELDNVGFEEDLSEGWTTAGDGTIERVNTVAYLGDWSLHTDNAVGQQSFVHQTVPGIVGEPYSARVRVRVDRAGGQVDLKLEFRDSGDVEISSVLASRNTTTGGAFVDLEINSQIAPAGTATVRLTLVTSDAEAYWDVARLVNDDTWSSGKTAANDGDVPSPPTITFHGPVTNPRLTNVTTGEILRINDTLEDGEQIEIVCGFGAPSVTRTTPSGTVSDAMGFLSVSSRFWFLETGNTQILYDADDAGTPQRGQADISYRKWYVGI